MPALSAPTSSAAAPDLGDGIGVLNVHSPFSQTACCLLFISAGSWLDPVGRCGLAHMYEHAFFAGASGLPTAAEVADEAAGLGCRHNAHTSREYMYFYLSGPATTARAAIDLLAACYRQAEPTPAELDKQRKAIYSELELFAGQRERRLRDLAARALYGDDGPGRPPLGVAAEIGDVTTADLRWFAEEAARRSRITLITDSPHEPAGPQASPSLAGLPAAGQFAVADDSYGPAVNVLLPADTGAVLMALVIPGPSYQLTLRETYALRLFHSIVGGSASARLQRRLRDQLGLAYQARTTLEMHATTGALLLLLTCRPAEFAQVATVAIDVVTSALAEEVDAAELARAREINRGTHVHERETAVGRCLVAGLELMRRQRVGHDAELFELWGDIGVAEVAAVASRVLRPELARAAVIGPESLTRVTGISALPQAWRLV